MDSKERVKIWNTFFSLTRDTAESLIKCKYPNCNIPRQIYEGGTLSYEDINKMSLIAWCILAVEARASHLIEERRDENKISRRKAKEALNKNIKEEWELLPKLYGKNKQINYDKKPHSAIKELYDIRNDLFHVNYIKLESKLNKLTCDDVIKYFVDFVDAMEDMNVILERGGRTEAKPEVLEIANAFRK